MRVWSAPLCGPAPLGPAAGRQRVAMGVAQESPCCCPSTHLGGPQRGQPEGQEGSAGAQTSSPASEFSAFSPSQALRSLRAPLTLAPTPEAAPITGALPPPPWNYAWSLCCPFSSSGFLGRVAESSPCGAVMLRLSSAQRAEGRSGSLGLWLPWGAQVSLPRSLRGRGAAARAGGCCLPLGSGVPPTLGSHPLYPSPAPFGVSPILQGLSGVREREKRRQKNREKEETDSEEAKAQEKERKGKAREGGRRRGGDGGLDGLRAVIPAPQGAPLRPCGHSPEGLGVGDPVLRGPCPSWSSHSPTDPPALS